MIVIVFREMMSALFDSKAKRIAPEVVRYTLRQAMTIGRRGKSAFIGAQRSNGDQSLVKERLREILSEGEGDCLGIWKSSAKLYASPCAAICPDRVSVVTGPWK